MRRSWNPGELQIPSIQTFEVRNLVLKKVSLFPISIVDTLQWFYTSKGKDIMIGKKCKSLNGTIESHFAMDNQFQWANGNDFFHTSTTQHKKLANLSSTKPHVALQKWRNEIRGPCKPSYLEYNMKEVL